MAQNTFLSAAFAALVGIVFVAGCASKSEAEGVAAANQADTLPSCESLGGECRSSPNDPIFPASCLDDFGRSEVHGSCASLTQACCAKPAVPDPVPACAAAGGECLGSPLGPDQPVSCLTDFGRPDLRARCDVPGTSCCQLVRPPLPSCGDLGGECKSSPNDPNFAATCEDDFGRSTLLGTCGADNQTCCAAPPRGPLSACEQLGGECRTSPVDPRFPASCEDDFGRSTLPAACGAGTTCCAN